jgi:predicted ATP-dependent protease
MYNDSSQRLEDMDPAFESRIHLSLNYTELDKTSRRQIWSTFLDHISKTNHTPAFTEAELDGLSKVPLNGRQIRNILKTAQLLADRYDDCLNISHIDTVLKLRKANERKTIGFFGASE